MELQEYIGIIKPDGGLALQGEPKRSFAVGEKVKVIIQRIPEEEKKPDEKLNDATIRLLEAIDKAEDIGATDDPEQLRHSTLFQERIEEKYS